MEKIIRIVLCYVVLYNNVYSDRHTHMSISYSWLYWFYPRDAS